MKRILKKIDNFFCCYIGINKQNTTPTELKIKNNKLIVSFNDSFKRHNLSSKLDSFFSNFINDLDEIGKKKLGTAMGKALAKNLIVSFDNILINEELAND